MIAFALHPDEETRRREILPSVVCRDLSSDAPTDYKTPAETHRCELYGYLASLRPCLACRLRNHLELPEELQEPDAPMDTSPVTYRVLGGNVELGSKLPWDVAEEVAADWNESAREVGLPEAEIVSEQESPETRAARKREDEQARLRRLEEQEHRLREAERLEREEREAEKARRREQRAAAKAATKARRRERQKAKRAADRATLVPPIVAKVRHLKAQGMLASDIAKAIGHPVEFVVRILAPDGCWAD